MRLEFSSQVCPVFVVVVSFECFLKGESWTLCTHRENENLVFKVQAVDSPQRVLSFLICCIGIVSIIYSSVVENVIEVIPVKHPRVRLLLGPAGLVVVIG